MFRMVTLSTSDLMCKLTKLLSIPVSRLFKIFLAAFIALSGAVILFSCSASKTGENTAVYTYKIVETYPHDREAFTQGLVFEDGVLYESAGLYGDSTLRKVELESGEILQIHRLEDDFFGEGITIYDNRIIQLTWKSKLGFVYGMDRFEPLQEFGYSTEGWGITHDGERLIMSDGTSTLYFLNPETFKETSRIEVRDEGKPINMLNELEYVKGRIYANIWLTEKIAIIAPQSGQVVGWVDLKGLLSLQDHGRPINVFNGIAYDAVNDRLFVTGKLWPKLFEIKLVPLK